MSRLSTQGTQGSDRRWFRAVAVLVAAMAPVAPAAGEVRVAPGYAVSEAVTGVPRPAALASDGGRGVVILSHGWRGDAAAELFRLDLPRGGSLDAARAPRVVIPFGEGPRQVALGSLAVDPLSGSVYLGEENGNRVYRLTPDQRLLPFAVGLHHLIGGSSLAFDRQGRLIILDFASDASRLRSESRPPPTLDWLAAEAYDGPLVFRLDPRADLAIPRRLDVAVPLYPRAWARRSAGPVPSRFISVAAAADDGLVLLGSLGDVLWRGADGSLRVLARLPAGHYHRTHMAMASDGSVLVSSGFHVRQLFRVSPDGQVQVIAWELGDPGGIALDTHGDLLVAETALHRIIRIRAVP